MSSSFSDQPPPHDPAREEAYTSEPRPRRTPDEPDEPGPPRLGSLAQKARSKQLNQARGILIAIGVLTIVVNGIQVALIRSEVQKEYDKQIAAAGGIGRVGLTPAQVQDMVDRDVSLNYVFLGIFLGLGVLFVIFGIIIHSFPVPVTILSLVLYLLGAVVSAFIDPKTLAAGLVIKIIIVVGLVKAIQAALAYEREKRESAELGQS
jgi:hypothetical protein